MKHYYSEFDPYAAEWLRLLMAEGLIPDGVVDGRDMREITANDLRGFDSVHLFAGVSGWPLALRIAGWPDDQPVWTGSCPCQPYSTAGKQKGNADERNLWPEMLRLVRECRPVEIFGEQVSNAIGHGWLDGISDDLEGEGYACGATVLPACGVGSPILRQRLFWYARELAGAVGLRHNRWQDSTGQRESQVAFDAQTDRGCLSVAQPDGAIFRGLASTGEQPVHEQGYGLDGWRPVVFACECDDDGNCPRCGIDFAECGCPGPTQDGYEYDERPDGLYARAVGCASVGGDAQGVTGGTRSQGYAGDVNDGRQPGRFDSHAVGSVAPSGAWSDFRIIHCRDGKSRRVSSQRGDEPLAYGIPSKLGPLLAALGGMGLDKRTAQRVRRGVSELLAKARRNRVGRLKGYGNAISPQISAVFIRAAMQCEAAR